MGCKRQQGGEREAKNVNKKSKTDSVYSVLCCFCTNVDGLSNKRTELLATISI